MSEVRLQVKNLCKSFGITKAVQNVSFNVNKGEVHALIGENGSGKSTLTNMLTGIYSIGSGTFILDGKEIHPKNQVEANNEGVSIIVAASMAYKMMVKNEPLDVMKLFKPLVVSIILCWWYPPADTGMTNSGSSWCVLDFLSYIPNCIGSYTHDLYEAEATQISDKFEEVQQFVYVRDSMYTDLQAQADVAHKGTSDPNLIEATMEQTGVDEVTNMEKDASKLWFTSLTAGAVVGIDKIVMLIALIVFRIGWWATIYCQQILLGMLTIFGPIQWAFSLLPKWEGAWAKWLTRYLTVHFYGAMLYFVGFYVLLLFDIVLCIQVENLTAITASEQTMAAYLQNSFFSAGYLMAASIVALKCLNLVPDLAAWMIPEGDTAFSTRNFGEGVAQQAKMTATGTMATVMR